MSTDNALPTKIIEQYLNGVYELQIVNDARILCCKSEVEILEYHPEKLQQKQVFRRVVTIHKHSDQQEQPQDHQQK